MIVYKEQWGVIPHFVYNKRGVITRMQRAKRNPEMGTRYFLANSISEVITMIDPTRGEYILQIFSGFDLARMFVLHPEEEDGSPPPNRAMRQTG